MLLGIVSIAYALYALSGLTMPELQERWGIVFGLFSGLLHGAYNVGGPPLVMYGVSRRWKPTLFKCNMASTFFVMGAFVIAAHFQQGNIVDSWISSFAAVCMVYRKRIQFHFFTNSKHCNRTLLLFRHPHHAQYCCNKCCQALLANHIRHLCTRTKYLQQNIKSTSFVFYMLYERYA